VSARFDAEGRCVVLLESKGGRDGADHRRFARITKQMERPEVVTGVLADGIPLAGTRELSFRVRGKELSTDAASFFQSSLEGAEELVRVVENMIEADGETRAGMQLLDLYAGCGLFAVCIGGAFERVVASDSDERAVRLLQRNLEAHGIAGTAHAEEAQVTLRKAPRSRGETVILDPPRTGMEKVVRRALIERKPERILAVSCDPATGARDAAEIVAAGYRLRSLAALDLFPVTAHVETVALLGLESSRD
jgi:23S rRNA (uracil1939-C5)-methyltransferase